MKKLLVALMAPALVLLALPASAKQEFPLVIRQNLQLTYAPPCHLCHSQGKTASGTQNTPFVMSMRARGFEDAGNLVASLNRMKADRVDSDGDGVTDIDELATRHDPNSAAPEAMLDDEPSRGCGIGRSPASGAFVFLALVVIALRRRERSHDDGGSERVGSVTRQRRTSCRPRQ